MFLNGKANSEMGTVAAVISIVYHGKSTPYGSMEIHCISSPVALCTINPSYLHLNRIPRIRICMCHMHDNIIAGN